MGRWKNHQLENGSGLTELKNHIHEQKGGKVAAASLQSRLGELVFGAKLVILEFFWKFASPDDAR